MLWLSVLVVYLLVGLTFNSVGPAARLRRDEVERIRRDDREEAEQKVRSFLVTISIVNALFWPIAVPISWRTMQRLKEERLPETQRRRRRPSRAVRTRLRKLQEVGIEELTFPEFHQLRSGVKGSQVADLVKGLDGLGITISGVKAEDPRLSKMSAWIAGDLYQPIFLTARADGESQFQPLDTNDEVWKFTTSSESWKNLYGRAGYALVRNGVVVDVQVTIMN